MPLDLRDRIAQRLRTMVAPEPPKGPFAATVIAVASGKGGVGKTTTAVNLGLWYARLGRQTLLVDLDPQGHVGTALGMSTAGPEAEGESVAEVLLGRRRDLGEVARATSTPSLKLVHSTRQLAEAEVVLATKVGREMLLREALAGPRSHFEVVVIDCPPNLGTLTLNALCAADALLVPADMSTLALEGAVEVVETTRLVHSRLQRAAQLAGVVRTRVDRRQRHVNQAVDTALAQAFGDQLLATQVPQVAAVGRAQLGGQSLLDSAPRSPAVLAYRALAYELGSRLGLGLGPTPGELLPAPAAAAPAEAVAQAATAHRS